MTEPTHSQDNDQIQTLGLLVAVGLSHAGPNAWSRQCLNRYGDAVTHMYSRTPTLIAGAGVAITAALVAFPESALQMFQTNAEMMPYAKTYCVIRYTLPHPPSYFNLLSL